MEDIVAFVIYGYLGPTWENIITFINPEDKNWHKNKHLKVAHNPIIHSFPLYGVGAYMVIFVNNYLDKIGLTNIFLKYIIFVILLTIFELIVGLSSSRNGYYRGWDYSDKMYNYKGIICPQVSLVWGLLALAIIKFHPILINWIKCGINCPPKN